MNMETIKTWLLSVGDDYHIHEAHYRQRRGLLPPARHWVYNDDIPATPYKGGPIRKTEQDGYDLIETITVKSNILISINAYAENGRSALYGLEASMAMDDVRVIFGQCVTMLGIQGDVTNLTLVDETEENPRWRYQANFLFVEWETYTRTRTNHYFDEYSVTGKTVDDAGTETDVVITNQ